MEHKIFQAELSQLHSMLDFIKDFSSRLKISPAPFAQMILACEEAVVNIISHGYPPQHPGTIEIECAECHHQKGIKITLKDRGVPFNPIDHIPESLPSTTQPIENQTLGGYGIYILTGVMDEVQYERVEGENRLTLIKYFA